MLIKDGDSIAFLGDSITQFGWEEKPSGYIRLVQDCLREVGLAVRILPAGVGGNTSREMLARLPEVLDQKPTWMTLNCGINDSAKLGTEEFSGNAVTILERAAAAGIKPVVMTPTVGADENLTCPDTVRRTEFAEILRRLSFENNFLLVDLNAVMTERLQAERDAGNLGLIFTYDGTHLNGLGNHLVAWELLEKLGVPERVLEAQRLRWSAYPCAVGMPEISVAEYLELEARAKKERWSIRDQASSIVAGHLDRRGKAVRNETRRRADFRKISPDIEKCAPPGNRIVIVSGQYFEMPSWRPSGYGSLLAEELASRNYSVDLRERRKTAQMPVELEVEVVPQKPHMVVIIPGTADFGQSGLGQDVTEFSANVAAAVAILQREKISPLLVTSLWVNASVLDALNDQVAEYNEAIRSLARQNDVPLLDLPKLIEAEGAVSFDGGAVAKCLINQILAAGILSFLGFDEREVAEARTRWLRKPKSISLPPLVSVRDFELFKTDAAGGSVNDYLATILRQNLLNQSSPLSSSSP